MGVRIRLNPEVASYMVSECKADKVILPATEGKDELKVEMEVVGKDKEGLCSILYQEEISPGNIRRYYYFYNRKGNLCAYESPGFRISMPKAICEFIPLL